MIVLEPNEARTAGRLTERKTIKPGDLIFTWSDDRLHGEPVTGLAIVLATSRHKHPHVIPAAEEARYEPKTETWFSVTKAQYDSGECPDEIDGPGFYWSDGQGKAWIQIAHEGADTK